MRAAARRPPTVPGLAGQRTGAAGRRTGAAGRPTGVAGRPDRARGAGDAPEVVAGRNAVLESLRARVPATALYAGPGTAPTRGSTR